MSSTLSAISPQSALIYVMVVAAVADEKLKDRELHAIGEFVRVLPVFQGFDAAHVNQAVGDCAAMLDQEDGLDAVLGLIKAALPSRLAETAYALACDIVAVDGSARQQELRWLEMVRHELGVDRLHAAAIERGARARFSRP